jgi:spore coat polysaccharide biosynthesis predicted glycosyltransferase SpsG
MRILFRTSGGRSREEELGLGHVYRCTNLAKSLKPHKIYFLVEDYGGVKNLLVEKGFKNVFFLRKKIDLLNDAKKTISLISSNKIDIVIIDRYLLDPKYVQELKKNDIKTVVITDLKNIEYPSDLVVSGFIGYENQIRINHFGTKCLLGPKYQILDERFSSMKNIYKKKYDFLATFGGFDDYNIAQLFLESVIKYSTKIKSKIILGPSTIKSKQILAIEKKYRNRIKIVQKTNNMYKEMSEARFGICAGGLTTYEFASLGVPFAIICQVKHQLVTAKQWHNKKIAINLGLIEKISQDKINSLLHRIINRKISLKTPKSSIIDGRGSMRVAMEVIKLNHELHDEDTKSITK